MQPSPSILSDFSLPLLLRTNWAWASEPSEGGGITQTPDCAVIATNFP